MGSTESRTDRLERLLGKNGVDKLASSRVMVIGLGGVGSNCVEALARSGIGSFVLVDPDVVQESNINRQAIAYTSTVGRPKVEVMREMVLEIEPDARVECVDKRILPEDVADLLASHEIDFCIDAQDTVMTKLALADYCARHDIDFISSMGAANTFNPLNLAFADIFETQGCPLSRVVRKKARKMGIASMPVLFSKETPAKTSVQEGSSRSDRTDLGTMSYMPAIMGQMLAAHVICALLGIEWE